jgi:hypothetical protein
MSHVRKGHLLNAAEWAKHLRRYGKKLFWRRHRRVEKRVARHEAHIEREAT